ncbi:hypothetical protein O9K51_02332 [Purpureocillium lavendulum]|uniref:Uncharacterized protein n=1 Tax=Purpureocillium lavendulum TaxID=1247861 RepID=A0AB34G0Z2_9HYPO|nr:hypothetical protein O9K51_02332 [Purpureocillium lavendulum]
MSPDTLSSLFPDRPIRPLPKRRLRERLSPEVADSIKYPSSTPDNVPLFYYPPYTAREENAAPSNGEPAGLFEHGRRPDPPSFQSLRNGVRPAAGEEQESVPRSTHVARSQPDVLTRTGRHPSRHDPTRPTDPQPPPSAASSVDGYESFENSNKKKRKIPSASDSVLNGASSLNSDLSSLGISENVSLLQQHSVTPKTTPASTQFTFTCDSQVPGTVQWPGHPNQQNMPAQTPPPGPNAPNGTNHETAPRAPGSRRKRAANLNHHNPPRPEDIWICEFCEYESIFKEPPSALIRKYEKKDRRHRLREAERKRLLEKAKAKSRKGRKGTKASTRGGHAAQVSEVQHQRDSVEDQDATLMQQSHSHSTQSEEDDYEDDFEDDYPSPPPELVPPLGDVEGGVIPLRTRA